MASTPAPSCICPSGYVLEKPGSQTCLYQGKQLGHPMRISAMCSTSSAVLPTSTKPPTPTNPPTTLMRTVSLGPDQQVINQNVKRLMVAAVPAALLLGAGIGILIGRATK